MRSRLRATIGLMPCLNAAIEREGEALGRLGKIRARDKTCRRKEKWALRKARRQCAEAFERFDAFEAAMDTVRGALEFVDVASGALHRPEQVEALIGQAAGRIASLGTGECTKLAKYLRNRSPGRMHPVSTAFANRRDCP